MKTAISVPDATFRRVDAAAKKFGMSRSEFYARAAERWLHELEGEDVTRAINEALSGVDVDTRFTDEAARRLFRATGEW
ncbi:type II toxin-antitoxin system HicB family antitoxin [Svornostia abyssi]|uniref:Type II toxin-antitoxin system HicB family antitoxin n=1 Tax=Svornostia abyssi TaxID=2898438 RepID=A0ABY5PAX4_9ACTN|nr:type II toxin-antitoxin system HicB family antitoxin [Parviterribacteraceae bacterium J379]